MLIVALALAVLIGLSLGLLGGGGSILTVPILRYVLGMEAHAAIGLSLLVVGLTSLAALVPHARAGRVRFRTGIVFGLAGMAGAYGAGRFAHYIPAPVLLSLFALMMFATAIAMLRKKPRGQPSGDATAKEAPPELPIAKVLLEGVVVGAVTGLVGAGGGFLVVPALVLLGNLPMELAVGTSLVVIAMKSLAGFAGYAGSTPIDLEVGLAMSAAAVVGSIAGGMLVTRVKPSALRTGFGWFVVAMGIFILGQELPALLGLRPSAGLAALLSLATTGVAFAAVRLRSRLGRSRAERGRPRGPQPSQPSARPVDPTVPSIAPAAHNAR
jgi:uncharacterized membrane protein YfcA